jgi:hypothetical protein
VPGEEVGRLGKTFANLYLAQYCEHDKVVNERPVGLDPPRKRTVQGNTRPSERASIRVTCHRPRFDVKSSSPRNAQFVGWHMVCAMGSSIKRCISFRTNPVYTRGFVAGNVQVPCGVECQTVRHTLEPFHEQFAYFRASVFVYGDADYPAGK